MKNLCERLFKEGWYVLYPIKIFFFLILKLISEYANIVVVEAAQVINTDVVSWISSPELIYKSLER